MTITRTEIAQKAIRLLKQPTPELDSHTDYSRPSTPYFTDVNEQVTKEVDIVVSCDFRNRNADSESNYRDLLKLFSIPAQAFYKTLGKLRPGCDVSMETDSDLVDIDRAWGFDCLEFFCKERREKIRIILQIGISKDMKTVTLKLLRREGDDFIPYAQLQQTCNARLS
jgi:hypothetical protein